MAIYVDVILKCDECGRTESAYLRGERHIVMRTPDALVDAGRGGGSPQWRRGKGDEMACTKICADKLDAKRAAVPPEEVARHLGWNPLDY